MPQKNAPKDPQAKKRKISSMNVIVRWIHIYLSMLGLFALLFFSVTGITVNHPELFYSGRESTKEFKGSLPKDWLETDSRSVESDPTSGTDKLAVVEYFRLTHQVRGYVSEFFSGDDYEFYVGFNGPGYTAYASIDRSDASYLITETSSGVVAVMNDLHKGRDTDPVWSWIIDISAVIMIIASLTGLFLLLSLKKRKRKGLVAALAGSLVIILVYNFLIP